MWIERSSCLCTCKVCRVSWEVGNKNFNSRIKKTKHYNSAHYSTKQNCPALKSPERSSAAVFPGSLPTGTRPPTMFRLWLILPPPSWACVVAENKLVLEPSRTGCCRCSDRFWLAMEGQILMPTMYYPCNSLTGPRWSDVFLMLKLRRWSACVVVDCPTQLICTWVFIYCVPWQS